MSLPARRSHPVALALLVLAGCTPLPERPDAADYELWRSRKAELTELEQWRLDGRVAVSAGEEGWNGALTWRQQADVLELNVRGPLGVGGFRANGSAGRLEVVTSDGEALSFSEPERELSERYGWSVPVERMRYWILGIPAPVDGAREWLDAHGRLERLEQDGWRVSYERYADYDGRVLPRRLELRKDDVRVRVVVDRWRLGA